jgi:hypothetical protein
MELAIASETTYTDAPVNGRSGEYKNGGERDAADVGPVSTFVTAKAFPGTSRIES